MSLPAPPVPIEVEPDAVWRRLSPRMLLVHPIREVGRFIPALFGIVLAGRNSGHDWWSLAAFGAVIVFSLLRWFTTRYQITPAQVQLRTGLFRRRTMTTPADRVRTVDVTAHALHRVLGLARVTIGTGTSDRKKEGLVLDGLTAVAAGALRAELLHREPRTAAPSGQAAAIEVPEQVLAELDPSWIRYAPFTLSGVLSAAAILGVAWRALNQAQVDANRVSAVRDATRHLRDTPLILDVIQVAVVLLIIVAVLSIIGYALSFWGFRLTRHSGGTLHVSRGLITSRNTSIEERRLRGVEFIQLLPLRLVGGARLLAVATGLRVGRGAERGGALLMPACPSDEAVRVAGLVLDDQQLPMQTPLTAHGPRARGRRYNRALGPAVVLWLGLLLWWRLGSLPSGWLVAGLVGLIAAGLLARDRYAGLGHAMTENYLVSQWGSLDRRRVVLEPAGIIGWKIKQSFFQRRAGLMSLVVTTAAGKQFYRITDVGVAVGLDLARRATPGLLDDFMLTREGES